jgi:hypothetical protein
MEILKNLVLQNFAGIDNPDGVSWTIGDDPVSYVQTVLTAIIGLAGLVAAAFIVVGAYTLITSSGEPENIAKGQKMITNAIIGLVLAAIAFLIVNFVIDFTPSA